MSTEANWSGLTAEQDLQPDRQALLESWFTLQQQLSTVKNAEMELRKKVVATFFDDNDREGTKRHALPDGYNLKVVKKQNYKLKNDNHETEKALEQFSEDSAAMLVKWSATLSVSNFKKLTDEAQLIFKDCLEITDASPTLEIEAPKR